MVLMSILTGVITEAPGQYLLGQFFLGLSVYFSLWLLADRPLLNPVQAVVALFYWWFGIGPTIVGIFRALADLSDDALYAQVSGMEGLWVVALGLPLYAFVARNSLVWLSKITSGLIFLRPSGNNYKLRTVITFFICGALAEIIIKILEKMDISGQEPLNYLGGTITIIWWIGAIAGIGGVLTFGKSAILSAIAQPWRQTSIVMKILGMVVLLISLSTGLTSGWKGSLVFAGLYIVVAYISRYQRIPWKWMAIGFFAYLFFVEPFTTAGRQIAESLQIQTPEERTNLFRQLITEGKLTQQRSWKEINIESPFRGIYQLAGEITRRNGLFDGEWQGYTIIWGLSALIPRVFYPEKPMLNVGNFFALTIGADLGLVSSGDYVTNISVSMPFEIVGNFGWLAGILSFGLIGAFWALFCVLLLSPRRLADHPLTPWLVGFAFGFEGAVGHFLAGLRSLIIPLAVTFMIWVFLRKKL